MSPTTSSSSSSGSSPEGGEGLLEGSSGRNEAKQKSLMQQQRQAEVLSLRERGAELEERLQAARTALTSARERREFMEEEAEQARDYGNKLAQEMARLGRITRTLPPDESASLEKLRRLVATLTEIERQEQAALEQGKAREAALRAEIAEFTGETAGDGGGGGGGGPGEKAAAVVSPPPDAAPATAGAPGGEGGGGARKGREGAGFVLEKAVDDPLAAMAEPQEQEGEDKSGVGKIVGAVPAAGGGAVSVPRTAVVLGGGENGGGGGPAERKANHRKKPALEGKALFAEGLHRIEAAYEVAAAEREESAARLSRLRLAVARRQREEDAALGHAELLQYLLRFEELGQHSLERQEQLRRCRAERSTLSLTRELLAKQARLLETIAGGVEEASKGGKGVREAYLRQIKGIVESVEDSLEDQTRLLDSVRRRRHAAEELQASVREDRKRFFAGTKELSDECYRYESLNAHLALMQR